MWYLLPDPAQDMRRSKKRLMPLMSVHSSHLSSCADDARDLADSMMTDDRWQPRQTCSAVSCSSRVACHAGAVSALGMYHVTRGPHMPV